MVLVNKVGFFLIRESEISKGKYGRFDFFFFEVSFLGVEWEGNVIEENLVVFWFRFFFS